MREHLGKDLVEVGYFVCLLPVLDAIIDMVLNIIANELSLGSELSSALLNFNGMQGASLQLAKAMEEEQWHTALELLKMIRPASKMDVVFQAMYDARAYADEVFASLSSVTD